MKFVYILLLAIVTLGAALFAVSFVHPGGLAGLQEDLFGEDAASDGGTRGEDGVGTERNGGSHAGGADELQQGHRAYDAGDFETAINRYNLASAFAAGENERRTAREGLDRAHLASALVLGSPRPMEDGDAARAEFDRLKSEAQARPTEYAWLAAARYGKGAGIERDLVYVVERCLDSARTGGPIEEQLRQAVNTGQRGRAVQRALKARGLNAEPFTAVATNDSGDGTPEGWDTTDETDPSGIGGVGRVKVKRIPFGTFSDALRRQLSEAVDLEAKGEAEHRAASPGSPDRAAHRKRALEHLEAARTIYREAIEADPKALGLERRLQNVQRMIYELKKDATIND